MKKWFFVLILLAGLGAGARAWAQSPPTPPPIQYPDLSVGVLSEDPGYGERWSTEIFPFGNYVGPTTGQDVFCRTYLKFPISFASDSFTQAVLHVYVDDYWPGPGGAPMSVYPVAEDWPAGVDWYDMATWPELGSPVATTQVTSDGGWFSWDVTGLVREWASGARPNDGLALAA
ncbi:MAG: DNRLRE domain-containing protein, partial [Thermoflexales bacterium]|nr:DNRLRE domain-containing protein [Thermoflexales bacterium]